MVFVENLNNLTTRGRVSFYMYTYCKDPSRDNKLNFYVYMEFKKNCRGSYIINTLLEFDQNNVIAKTLSGGSYLNISKFINVDFKDCKELLYWQGVPKGEKPSKNRFNFSFVTEFDLYEIALKNNTMPDLFKVKLKKDLNALSPKTLDTNENSSIPEILNTQELENFKLLKNQKKLTFKGSEMFENKRRRKIKKISFSEIPLFVMKHKVFYLVQKDFDLNIEIYINHYKSDSVKKKNPKDFSKS